MPGEKTLKLDDKASQIAKRVSWYFHGRVIQW